jgi:hypothetical protein
MDRLDRRKFGFWYTLFEYKKSRLAGKEGIAALVIGGGGGVEILRLTSVAQRLAIAGDFLTLISALVGVVLAGFALVVAFLSDSYTLQLQKNPKGVRAFFAPFMINIGIDVGFIIGVVAYRAVAANVLHALEKTCFVVLSMIFVFAALNITALTRTIMAHGVTRAELITMEHLEKQLNDSDAKNDLTLSTSPSGGAVALVNNRRAVYGDQPPRGFSDGGAQPGDPARMMPM